MYARRISLTAIEATTIKTINSFRALSLNSDEKISNAIDSVATANETKCNYMSLLLTMYPCVCEICFILPKL